MKYTLHAFYWLLGLALLTGCKTTTNATGDRAVDQEVAQQLANLQAQYASGELEYDISHTSGVGQDSESAYSRLHVALIEYVYGAEAAGPFRLNNDYSKSPIRVVNCQLLETKLKSARPHWTNGKTRMRVKTTNDGEFEITYTFRITLNKIANAPPAWADELYTEEQIIHSLGGFEVISVKRLNS